MHTICARCGKATVRKGRTYSRSELPTRRRGNAWKPVVVAVLERDHAICQLHLRGCTGKATLADHIIPRAQGGTDAMSNLQASCAPCNRKKGSGTLCATCQVGGRSPN